MNIFMLGNTHMQEGRNYWIFNKGEKKVNLAGQNLSTDDI